MLIKAIRDKTVQFCHSFTLQIWSGASTNALYSTVGRAHSVGMSCILLCQPNDNKNRGALRNLVQSYPRKETGFPKRTQKDQRAVGK